MFSRIFLFLLANFGVLAILSISMRVLGVDAYLAQQGGSFQLNGLLLMAAIMGFAGSFISLALSKTMAKRSMGVQLIETPRNETEQWLVKTVQRQAREAGIGMPEVGIFPADVMNAFATGMNRNNALVAVSSGLLQEMSRDEVEAVLGHEVRPGLLDRLDSSRGGAWHRGRDNRFLVFTASRVSRRCRRCAAGRYRENDRGAATFESGT